MKSVRFALLMAAACLCTAAGAQSYPAKAVRFVVPFAPGGGLDISARILTQRLGEQFGYNPIVDNRPGANGNLGAELVAKAPPDGYTLLMSAVTLQAINVALYPKLNYDLQRDFVPISLLAQGPLFMVVHPSLPVRNVKEFVALARARPGQLSYASSGTGSSLHLAGVMFDRMTGVKTNHVPYRGGGPAIVDLAGGHVEFAFSLLGIIQQFVDSGRLRNIGVASLKRYPELPNIPTLDEQGVKGFEADTWYGLMAPAGTPAAIIDKLHADVAKAMSQPDIRRRFTEQGMVAQTTTSAEFARYLANDIARYGKLVRESGIKIDF